MSDSSNRKIEFYPTGLKPPKYLKVPQQRTSWLSVHYGRNLTLANLCLKHNSEGKKTVVVCSNADQINFLSYLISRPDCPTASIFELDHETCSPVIGLFHTTDSRLKVLLIKVGVPLILTSDTVIFSNVADADLISTSERFSLYCNCGDVTVMCDNEPASRHGVEQLESKLETNTDCITSWVRYWEVDTNATL